MANVLGKEYLVRKIKGEDLFAKEARYHDACRNALNLEYYHHTRVEIVDAEYIKNRNAHRNAYGVIKEYVQKEIINDCQVLKLSSLRYMYVLEMQNQSEPSPGYRAEKLMNKLQKDETLGNFLAFSKVTLKSRGSFSFFLVYNTSITLQDAMACAYQVRTSDYMKVSATSLRCIIREAFMDSEALPWPPTADDMRHQGENLLPDELIRFLTLVLTGSESCQHERAHRYVLSIGQDICRIATDSEWKLPKHILLCATIRHLYRSKGLTTILQRLGHCESYDFGLELETAVAKATDAVSTNITPSIVTGDANEVFHSEWDNLNKITTNVHESNIINSAGGIIIQETKPDVDVSHHRTLPTFNRTKERRLTSDTTETLPAMNLGIRVGPKFPAEASFTTPVENNDAFKKGLHVYYIWMLSRY
ncbi:uncharacterized protein [Argopecten irradians]|uniref:uncharacterized protein isoform X1 n=1 Tax=Argopecten irradians TaxID=31199 RepID=UPI0037209A3F